LKYQSLDKIVASTLRRIIASCYPNSLLRNSESQGRAAPYCECVKRYDSEILRNTLRQDRAYGLAFITRKSVRTQEARKRQVER